MQTTPSVVHVLLVEDDEDDFVLTRTRLANAEGVVFELDWIRTYAAALEAIRSNQHDVYLIDYRLGGHNGLELLREAIAFGCEAPLILLTGMGDQAVDVEAMQVGAADYLIKDQISASLLVRSIRHALERGRILAALRTSERRVRVLFDQTFQLIELLNPAGIVLEVNQSVLDFAQVEAAEIVGLPIWQFPLWGVPGTSNRLQAAVAEAAAGAHTRCEIDLFGPTGTIVTLDLSLKPVRDVSGHVTLIIAEGRDISQRRRAEAELHASQARLAGILDIADDAIIVVNGRQEIELFNQGAERIFGYTAAEVLGQPLDMLLPVRVAATHRQHIHTFAASAEVARRMGARRDIFGLRRDGSEFPAEASISKLTTTGQEPHSES